MRGVTFLNINRSKTRRETLFISLRDPARTLEQSRVIGLTPAGREICRTSNINNKQFGQFLSGLPGGVPGDRAAIRGPDDGCESETRPPTVF